MNYAIAMSQNNQVQSTSKQTFEQLAAIFLSNKDMKASSRIAYASSFKQFTMYLQERSITEVNELDVKEFKDYLTNKKLSMFTIISHISALKSLFTFLAVRGLYPNIAKDIKTPKKPREFMRDPLTKDQAQKLIKNASGDDIAAKRDFAIISILLRCGLRSIEIVRADIGDIRQSSGTPVLWVHGKGRDSKDEFVVLTNEALTAINDYLMMRPKTKPHDPLFASHGHHNNNGRLTTRSIRRLVKDHLKSIGINNNRLTCHSLRHTFATLALANNAPLIAVQQAMRHANINTTTIYTHMQERLTKGAEQFIDIPIDENGTDVR